MYLTCAVFAGFVLDWILGDPKWLPHPICAVGRLISLAEKLLRRLFPPTPRALDAVRAQEPGGRGRACVQCAG